METYLVKILVFGLFPATHTKAGELVQMRPEDAAQYVADGVLELVAKPKIKTKEEKTTKK